MSTPEDSGLAEQANSFPANSREPQSGPPSLDPNNPPWGLLQAFLTWTASLVLLWLVPQLCALPYVATHYRGMAGPTKEMLLSDRTFILIIVVGFIPAHLLTLIIAWVVASRLGKISPTKVLGLRVKSAVDIILSALAAPLLFFVAMILTYNFGGQDTDLEKILRSSRAAALIVALVAVSTAPLVEEVIYRGLLYSALQRVAGPFLAVVVITSMFAGLHVIQYWPNAGAISAISLLSLVLTVVRARTGRLLPCYVIHLVFNGIQSILIVVEPYLRSVYQGWRPDATKGILHFLFNIL